MRVAMLTTIDNPYDPFEEFELWWNYDETRGYHSCGLVARIAKASDNLTEEDYALEVERAIDEIVRLDLTNNYKKVTKEIELDDEDTGVVDF